MNTSIDSIFSILKKPSAWIPIAISLVFLAYLAFDIMFFGVTREKDEGTATHLFQLWLVLEPLMIAYFTFKWITRTPKQTMIILLIQIMAVLLPVSIVFDLKL